MEFSLRLCGDVLVELLQYGDRHRLIKIERVGSRFHRIMEDFFGVRPLIRYDLQLGPVWYDYFVKYLYSINVLKLATLG